LDLGIALALIAIRSEEQSTTVFSFFFLLFNRDMRIPADLYYDLSPREPSSATESGAKLRQVLTQFLDTLSNNKRQFKSAKMNGRTEKPMDADLIPTTWYG
jgi:hypothetical protein